MKKNFFNLFIVLFITTIVFSLIDWSVDGFDFFTFQSSKYYFQSWLSLAGIVFSFIMFITTFIIYKKSDIASLKFISLSFLLSLFAYASIGYHTSYCQMCSDLSMCGASHNYPNYLIIIVLTMLVLSVLVANIKKSIVFLKLLSYGLILATFLLMGILLISVEYMEIPTVIDYVFSVLNLQGFVFVFPLIFIIFIFLYMRKIYKFTTISILIFILAFSSFLPQAVHIFTCNECHIME